MNLFRRRETKDNANKTADRLFLQSFVISIIGALVGIMALSTSTWAWFASSINSNTSTIEIGYCEMYVGITENLSGGIATISDMMIDSEDSLEKVENDGYYKELKADTSYIINLVPEGTASTCYCRININGDDYLTEQISIADEEIFAIELVSKIDTDIKVFLRWGTGSETNRDLESGISYIITEDGVICSDDYEEEDTEEEDTEEVETDEADSQDDEASTEAESNSPETSTPDTEGTEPEVTGDGQEETVIVPAETESVGDDESTQTIDSDAHQEDTSFEREPEDDVTGDYVETNDELSAVETTDESILDS